MIIPSALDTFLTFTLNQEIKSKREEGGNATGLISQNYEKYYTLMEVLHIFSMVFKVKPISNWI